MKLVSKLMAGWLLLAGLLAACPLKAQTWEPWQQLASYQQPAQLPALDSLLSNSYQRASVAQRGQLYRRLQLMNGQSDGAEALLLIWRGTVGSRAPVMADTDSLYDMALAKSLEANEPHLMIYCMERYALHAIDAQRPEVALFYRLKAYQLRQQAGSQWQPINNAGACYAIGDLFYQMEEYRPAIAYLQAALAALQQSAEATGLANTIGLCYHRLGQADSARYWLQQALQNSRQHNASVWQGIVLGNIGALLADEGRWSEAMPLLWADFRSSYAAGEKNSAGNTLQRLAYCYQQMRRTDSALVLARQALQMTAKQLDAGYKPHYHTNALRSMALILQGSGQYDSALVYTQRYFLMKDSLNQRLWEKRAKQVGSQLAYDQMQHRVQTLMQERKTSSLLRNALVAGLVLLALIGWLWAINQRRRQQLKQADAHYQQQLADRRMQHLQEQLADLTRQMTEKNDLLQILQAQTSGQNAEAVEALRQARLLTESDWLQFKHLFEQVQPGFLQRLRQLVPDVTSAEMRYASLLRLQLGAKDIAAMLGVSPDAVRKTKSRLRQRLPAAHADQPLEELVQVL